MDRMCERDLGYELWCYLKTGQKLEPSDCAALLGSKSRAIPIRGKELYDEGLVRHFICSGGVILDNDRNLTEAQVYGEDLINLGIPADEIYLDGASTNTGANVAHIREIFLLNIRGDGSGKITFIHVPYMERRVYATVKKQWPEITPLVTSPQIPFGEYPLPFDRLIFNMMAQFYNILAYPEQGYHIPQPVSSVVFDAYTRLFLEYNHTSHVKGDLNTHLEKANSLYLSV